MAQATTMAGLLDQCTLHVEALARALAAGVQPRECWRSRQQQCLQHTLCAMARSSLRAAAATPPDAPSGAVDANRRRAVRLFILLIQAVRPRQAPEQYRAWRRSSGPFVITSAVASAMVALLRSSTHNQLQHQVCRAVLIAFANADNAKALCRAGLLPVLVALLAQRSSTALLCQAVCGVLWMAAADHRGVHGEGVVAAGALLHLVGAIVRFRTTRGVCETACQALSTLVCGRTERREAVLAADGVAAALSVLREHGAVPQGASACESACSLLINLMSHTVPCKQAVMWHGGVALLQQVLSHHATSPHTAAAACGALFNLAEVASVAIARSNALADAFVAAHQHGSQHLKVAHRACDLLRAVLLHGRKLWRDHPSTATKVTKLVQSPLVHRLFRTVWATAITTRGAIQAGKSACQTMCILVQDGWCGVDETLLHRMATTLVACAQHHAALPLTHAICNTLEGLCVYGNRAVTNALSLPQYINVLQHRVPPHDCGDACTVAVLLHKLRAHAARHTVQPQPQLHRARRAAPRRLKDWLRARMCKPSVHT